MQLTEKLHGTFCGMGIHPLAPGPIVFSKGLGLKGLTFKTGEGHNERTVYVQIWRRLESKVEVLFEQYSDGRKGVYVLGDIFGPKVQDLRYGQTEKSFRVFDICVAANRSEKKYLPPHEVRKAAERVGLDCVPVLYEGPWSPALLDQYLDGPSAVPGADHIREGAVIRPLVERYDPRLGRVIVKAVSERYLLRRGGTEFN